MRLIDPKNDNDRRAASIHYQRMAKQAQRQLRRKHRIQWLQTRHFAIVDMVALAIMTAMFTAGVMYLMIGHNCY